jgi:radical SAM superfamily enzyme YgiQ (UPF0313 family)
MDNIASDCVILVQLYGELQPPDAEPLSIELLASAMVNHLPFVQIELRTLSITERDAGIQQIIDLAFIKKPVAIGISVPQSTFNLAVDLIKGIYQTNMEIQVILGHALPTHSPDFFLQIFPNAIIVRGWGEESFAKLVEHCITRAINLHEIPNLCYLRDGELHFSPPKWPSESAMPIRVSPDRYFSRVESSRGCHHDVCTFCTRQPRDRKSKVIWRRRPISDTLDDIRNLKSEGMQFFTFADEDFVGNDLVGAQKIVDGLAQIGGLNFTLSVRADNVFNPHGTFAENEQRRRLFESLREAGLYLVFVGVESLSDTQLKRYGKGVTANQSIEAVRIIQRLGIGLEMGYILFDPLLTKSELIENIKRLDQSGLWSNVGYLYNRLRPQKESPYMQLLVMSELIGEYDPNTMSYGLLFTDSLVGEIAQSCDNWFTEFLQIFALARNIERNSASSGAYARFVFSVRSLQFRLLRALVQLRISENQIFNIQSLSPYSAERDGLVRNLYSHLATKSDLTSTEFALKRECELFMDNQAYNYMREF